MRTQIGTLDEAAKRPGPHLCLTTATEEFSAAAGQAVGNLNASQSHGAQADSDPPLIPQLAF